MEGVGSARRRSQFVLAIVAVAVVLVALVAASGRVALTSDGSDGVEGTRRPPPGHPAAAEPHPADRSTDPVDIPGVGGLAVVIQAAFLIAGLTVLIAAGRAFVRWWPRQSAIDDEPPPERDGQIRPDEIVDALDEGLEALAEGPVDEVVIACWVRLEAAAAAAGVERRPSETPAELAARVLGELHAPGPAVTRLLVRYRTARFSDHDLDDHDRAIAVSALREIRAAIAAATPMVPQ